MPSKFTFQLTSDDRRRPLPHKILFGQQPNETTRHIALKFLAWVLFHRDRLQVETNVQNDAIPFVPDLVELGYDMRPKLWVECGDCSTAKLHKLATKCPDADLWIVKKSPADAQALLATMAKEEFRRGRYSVIALETGLAEEVAGLIRERNQFHWFRGGLETKTMQFELNELWFDTAFEVFTH